MKCYVNIVFRGFNATVLNVFALRRIAWSTIIKYSLYSREFCENVLNVAQTGAELQSSNTTRS